MKSGLKSYVCEWEKELNVPLMTKEADAPLVEYIKDVWESLIDVIPQVELEKFEYTEKESEIDINKHVFKRMKKKKKKDRYDVKNIMDDRCGKLTIHLRVTMLEKNPSTGETTWQVYPIKKSMLIPLQDENGYYTIKGKNYYLIYQMLEKSTYTSAQSVTLKSLMPIAVKRNVVDMEDINGVKYVLPCYYVFVFRREIPVILFYLSKGLNVAMEYLNMNDVINFVEKLPCDPDQIDNNYPNMYFQLSNKCYLEVDRAMFKKYPYVQSVVGAFGTVCTNRVTLEHLNDPKQWVKKIANPANYENGNNILKYFNRLLDKSTQKILKVPEYYSSDIYTLLRWIMENFNDLRMKDNCDLANKRLRCNEYIASLLTKEFSRRLNRIISMGDKVTIDNIRELFRFSGDVLINKMHSSGILRFDDNVNDMSFWSKFKFTNKGPHSLGGTNSNNIGIKYRGLHPSHLGQIDVLVCGNSDPGTSGLLSPFAKIDGLYFDSSEEPDSFYYELVKDLEKKFEGTGVRYIHAECDSPEEYYNILKAMEKYANENVKMYGTSKEGVYDFVIHEDIDMDEDKSKTEEKKEKGE